MEKSSSEDSSIHRSPSLDSKDSDFAKPSTSGRSFGRGFTAGAFYGTAGSRGQSRAEAGVKTDKYNAPKGSKYVVFYLDLSFVFLLEFKKCNMARGCLCCLKYMMFLFNLIFWFFIVLLIILLSELILLILFFVYMDKVNENAKRDLKEGLLLYNTENNVGLKNAWNIIQAEMHCCGVSDYTDWYPVLGENTVPDRCCMENSQGCGRNSTTPVWRTGCYEKVKMWFDDNKHVLGTVGMCILIMQILGMAFSMTLFQHIHRTGKKYDA
ncbi:tetraspanin-9 isoform X2 [Phyllostomus discolor]|uniref:Tetraspanin-9 n=1 Tax=Phyllostomus discolor TaxID=89673 RepID=A0A7E6D834_9CHIR|nr:tetraspanin-9 isoform X2 [Phyllostomus discolor]